MTGERKRLAARLPWARNSSKQPSEAMGRGTGGSSGPRAGAGLGRGRGSPRRPESLGKAALWMAGSLLAWGLADAILPAGLPLGIILLGIVLGALGALTAMGIVLIYRSARIVNFAQADIGGLAAAVAVVMVTGAHLPYFAALPLGLAAALLTGLAIDATIIRRFFKAPRLIVTVATIGVAQILGAGELGLPTLFSHLSPTSTFTTPFHLDFQISPIVFSANDLVAVGVVPVVLIGLWWFLGRTDTGVAIRAAAESGERAELLGIPVKRLSRITWIVAAGLSGIGAMLSAPILGPNLGVVAGPTSLLAPLAAAILAGMDSLPVAFLASLGIGIFQQAVLWSYPRSSSVDVALFALVLLGVVLRKKSLGRSVKQESLTSATARQLRPIPKALAKTPEVKVTLVVGILAILVLASLGPIGFSAAHLTLLTSLVIYALIALSLVVLTGWAGQISLGQFAFVGIGAGCAGAMLVHAHADLFLVLGGAALAGGVAALLLGLPSLRIPGLYLAVVTMAFAVPVSTWLLDGTYFPALTPQVVRRPVLFDRVKLSSPLALYEFCLVLLVVAFLLARNFRRSRTGRVVLAVRENERAASSYGIAPWRAKLVAFTFSGMLAGLAGALYTLNLRGVSFAGFDPEKSIVVFTMVVVGGMGSLGGAILGALYVQGAQYFLTGAAQLLATGAGLLVLLLIIPGGIGEIIARIRDRLLVAVARERAIAVPALDRKASKPTEGQGNEVVTSPSQTPLGVEVWAPPSPSARRGPGDDPVWAPPSPKEAAFLAAQAIGVCYGSVQVLFGADLAVQRGQVMALLGTNGAGKSTLLKAIAGVLPAKEGRVLLEGRDITRWEPAQRVQAGLVMVPGGRGVFPGLTVEENLRMGGWLLRGNKAELASRIEEVLQRFPALRLRYATKAGMLSGGEQQMLTLAQAMIMRPRLLLIDELSLGLAPVIVADLLEVLRQLSAAGTTIVVVEQSLNVAASIAPTAVFMERGQVRFSGPTRDLLQRGDLARAVFLGNNAQTAAPHGDLSSSQAAPENGVRENGRAPAPGISARGVRTSQSTDLDSTRELRSALPGAHQGSPRFAVQNLSVIYGEVAALTNVSLEVRAGEILGIIGANGAGKTTLMDACSGFVPLKSGRILLEGLDLTSLPAHERSLLGVGRLFQDAMLFPSMTVAEALATSLDRHVAVQEPIACTLGLGAARDSEEEVEAFVEQLLSDFGLEGYRDVFIGELSTGTRRIVELAGVMAHRPSVLLADEPSSGIAQRETEALARALVGIVQTTGAGLVVIEHDVPMISSIADRLICLNLGCVIAEGPPDEVLNDPLVIAAYLGEDDAAIARSEPWHRFDPSSENLDGQTAPRVTDDVFSQS